MGMSAPNLDMSGQQAEMQANLERDREYRRGEEERQRTARLEEERMRMSLERAFKEEQYAAMEAEAEEVEKRESAVIEEGVQQSETMNNIMGFFSDRPAVQIKDSM